MRFGDFCEIQPKVSLKKDSEYLFLPMEDVNSSFNIVRPTQLKQFSGGGARFSVGDTVFARITPCLENGKIAQVSGHLGGEGFGSTEFLVFRARPGISDPDFLFYLAKSSRIVAPAIKSMVGSSGRQRARREVIEEIDVPDIPLRQQEKIASTLRVYDDLIDNNRRRIEILENAARMIYREWFIRNRFPGHEHTSKIDGVLEGWATKTLADVCQTVGGGTPSTKVPEYWTDGDVTWVTPTDITRNNCLALLDGEKKISNLGLQKSSAKLVPPNTILMTSRASVGFFGLIDREVCTNQGFINVIPNSDNLRCYLLFNLMSRVDEIRSHAGGTTYAEISKSKFRALSIIVPPNSLVSDFQKEIWPMLKQVFTWKKHQKALEKTRDLLLPRLMDGRIEI